MRVEASRPPSIHEYARNSSAPMTRKCSSGSRSQRPDKRGTFLISWRVPDRRGIAALLERHGHFLAHRDLEPGCIVGGPARRRDFDDPRIVEGADLGIEIGILPDGD